MSPSTTSPSGIRFSASPEVSGAEMDSCAGVSSVGSSGVFSPVLSYAPQICTRLIRSMKAEGAVPRFAAGKSPVAVPMGWSMYSSHAASS